MNGIERLGVRCQVPSERVRDRCAVKRVLDREKFSQQTGRYTWCERLDRLNVPRGHSDDQVGPPAEFRRQSAGSVIPQVHSVRRRDRYRVLRSVDAGVRVRTCRAELERTGIQFRCQGDTDRLRQRAPARIARADEQDSADRVN